MWNVVIHDKVNIQSADDARSSTNTIWINNMGHSGTMPQDLRCVTDIWGTPVWELFTLCWESMKLLQLSAVLTRPNMTWYCIHHSSDWGRIYIRISIHKRHPISHPSGWAMGCILWGFWRKLTALWQHHTVVGCRRNNEQVWWLRLLNKKTNSAFDAFYCSSAFYIYAYVFGKCKCLHTMCRTDLDKYQCAFLDSYLV